MASTSFSDSRRRCPIAERCRADASTMEASASPIPRLVSVSAMSGRVRTGLVILA
jgi:hypothetical protein